MADIFISYKSENRGFTELLSDALVAAGFSTWWDGSLVAGETYTDRINSELQLAKVVLVVWSESSWESKWVKEEAAIGRHLDKLVSLRIDQVKIGVPFFTVHTSDFTRWNGDNEDEKFMELLSGIKRIIPYPERDLTIARVFHFTFDDMFTNEQTIPNVETRMNQMVSPIGFRFEFFLGTPYAINYNVKTEEIELFEGGNNYFVYYGSISQIEGFAEDVFLPGIQKLERKLAPFTLHIGSNDDHVPKYSVYGNRLPPSHRHIKSSRKIIDGPDSVAKDSAIGQLTSEVVFRTLRLTANK
jgi:hypothetical protein